MGINQSLINRYLKTTGNKYAEQAIKGTRSDITDWVDSGSYTVNALLSGSIYGGYPCGRFTGLAGKSATGKTFFALQGVQNFLEKDPNNIVFYFDSEGAVDKEAFVERGIDASRVIHFPVKTVEDFKNQVVKLVEDEHELIKDGTRKKGQVFIVLDSLGMLASEREVDNARKDHNAADFTRSKVIRATFRAVTLEMSLISAAGVITNHTYDNPMSTHSIQEMAGGGGLKYAASIVLFLNKLKGFEASEKKGSRSGIRLRVVCAKGRKVIEDSEIITALSFKKGLAKYYGLVSLAVECGVWKKEGNYVLTDSGKTFESTINKNPEKYFTKKILDSCEAVAYGMFRYGVDPSEESSKADETDESDETV